MLHRISGKAIILAIIACLTIAVAAFWAGTVVHGEAPSIPQKILEPRATAEIHHGLMVDRLDARGTLQLQTGVAVKTLTPHVESGAVPLVTALPVRPGSIITNGQVLVEIAGEPVIALEGEIPMYRPLKTGLRGPDVAQFQHSLIALGYSIGDPIGTFGMSTAAAAAAMFRARGYSLPLERISSLSSIRRRSEGGHEGARRSHGAAAQQFAAVVPVASIVYLTHLPAQAVRVMAHVGREVGSTLLTASWGEPQVSVSLEESTLQTLRTGMRATWVGHRGVTGVITGIKRGASAAAGSGSGEGSASPDSGTLTVAFSRGAHLPPIGEQIELSIIRRTSGGPVWSVPLSALRSNFNGENYVEISRGGEFTKVTVGVGSSIGGYVAIDAPAGVLRAGSRVAVGE